MERGDYIPGFHAVLLSQAPGSDRDNQYPASSFDSKVVAELRGQVVSDDASQGRSYHCGDLTYDRIDGLKPRKARSEAQ